MWSKCCLSAKRLLVFGWGRTDAGLIPTSLSSFRFCQVYFTVGSEQDHIHLFGIIYNLIGFFEFTTLIKDQIAIAANRNFPQLHIAYHL